MRRAFALLLACVAGPLVGCSATSDPPAGADPPGSPVDLIQRTVVHVDASGAPSVHTTLVPRAQSIAEAAVRAARLAARTEPANVGGDPARTAAPESPPGPDLACAASDIWIYDASGFTCPPTGYKNEICFAFSPDATYGDPTRAFYTLSRYPRCVSGYRCWRSLCACADLGTWERAVGAYWPGASRGFIEGVELAGPNGVFATFDAWGACTTAATQSGGARSVEALQNALFVALAQPGQ